MKPPILFDLYPSTINERYVCIVCVCVCIYIYTSKRSKRVRKAMPDYCWYKLILTKNDFMMDVSTVEQPSSAAYKQFYTYEKIEFVMD